MTVAIMRHQQVTLEDLKGLRAEGYIRDSTLDQRDGYGPEIQRQQSLVAVRTRPQYAPLLAYSILRQNSMGGDYPS